MKRSLTSIFVGAALLLALAALGGRAQTAPAPAIRSGSSLPSTCSPTAPSGRSLFFKQGASSGLYQCLATNTWTVIAGSVSSPTSLSLTYSNNLATAIASIGSASTFLPVTQDSTCTTALVLPATLTLRFENGAKIVKGSGCTVEFQGLGIANSESELPIFSGFAVGDVEWTGSVYPKRVSSNLWADASLGERLLRAIASLDGKQSTVVAYPGNIAAQVTVTSGLTLFFSAGTYTCSTADTPFILQSDTAFLGEGQGRTFITEPAALAEVIRASGVQAYPFDGYNQNIEVADITFVGNPSTPIDSSKSTVFLGNVTNGRIWRNTFDRTHGFAAYVGGFSTAGHVADGAYITENICIGLQTQNIGTVGGRNIFISRNLFIVSSTPSAPSQAIIDIEPNALTEGSDNIQVTDNTIDGRLAQVSFNGITVQRAFAANVRNIRVAGNLILGMSNTIAIFRDAEIDAATETISVFGHGLQTGQPISIATNNSGGGGTIGGGLGASPYSGWVIRTGIDTIKIASSYANSQTATAVNLTAATGFGEYVIVPVRYLANGIQLFGVESGIVENNQIVGASQTGISVADCYGAIIRGNSLTGVGGGGIKGMRLESVVDSVIENNTLQATQLQISQDTTIEETHGNTTVSTTSGSPNISVDTDGAYLSWWFRGKAITINSVDYTIREKLGLNTLILTGNAASTLSDVPATIKASSNSFRDNKATAITTAAGGTSVVYSSYTDFRKKGTFTVDPASVAANTVSTQTFSLVGAVAGDTLILNPPALTAGLAVMQVTASGTDTVSVTFYNSTGSPIDQASGSWNYMLAR